MEIADRIASVLDGKGNDIWSITPQTTVFDAIKLMSEKNIGALLVMDGAELVGIISERDYTRKVILEGKYSKDTSVEDIMSTEVVTVTPHDSVPDALRTISERRVRHLPVLEAGRLVGVVSVGDLVKWTILAQGAMIDQLESFIKGSYPT